MNEMLTGAIAMASFIAGLFFLRFWKSTGDRFFLYFAASFFIEGLNRALMDFNWGQDESMPGRYLVRLLAYSLILVAIWEKNRAPRNVDDNKKE